MSFTDLLNQLREEYVNELPQKIAHIANSYARKDWAVLKEDFHKLKGTGRTYGIPEISDLAEILERLCMDRPEALERAVPQALELLNSIHQRRVGAQAFDINQDQRFSSLKQLAS